MDRKEKRARNRVQKTRRKRPKYKLHLLWHKEVKNFEPEDLIYIVLKINYLSLQKRALKSFLGMDNLTFDNFDQMGNAAKTIFDKNPTLKKRFYEQCFSICTENNLAELGEKADVEAIKELIRRVKTGSAKHSGGLRALIRLFEKSTTPESRMELWNIIKQFNPCEKDLIYLHNIVYGNYGFEKVTEGIQRYLKRKRKETQRKTILRIEELVTQIKQKQE